MRLVEPLLPMGTPAGDDHGVAGLHHALLAGALHTQGEQRSEESTVPDRQGFTPQEMASCRRTFSVWHMATMGQGGR
jgi:hypothetical protein